MNCIATLQKYLDSRVGAIHELPLLNINIVCKS